MVKALKDTIINENTLIPISLVCTFVGAVIWATMLYADTNQHKHEIAEIKSDYKELINEFKNSNLQVIERLAHIEERLKALK